MRDDLTFILVERIEQVLPAAFNPDSEYGPVGGGSVSVGTADAAKDV